MCWNFFLFGLSTEEVFGLKAGGYHPWEYYESDAGLKAVIDGIAEGQFADGNRHSVAA